MQTRTCKKYIIFLNLHGKANATGLSRAFESALDPIQKTLKKLEEGGLLASFLEGKTRVFPWNSPYPFLKEIQHLTEKAYTFLSFTIQETYFQEMEAEKTKKVRKTSIDDQNQLL